MENKEIIQNQYNDEAAPKVGEAISKTLEDCHVIAVLLVNFGGPSSENSVKSFLYNLFSDPQVINFPLSFIYRKPLAWLISNIRNKISSEMYKSIGSISPLIPITYLQAQKLQELIDLNKLKINTFIGFRYSKPFIEDVLTEIKSKGYKKIVVLPMYPQYSFTTTGSAELAVNIWLKKNKGLDLLFVREWYKDEDYLESYVRLIQNSLKNLDLRSTEILFSAHSIPYNNIKKGDPYQKHITETAEKIINKINWKKRWHIGYQSKLGPIKWLEPSTDKVIQEVGERNKNANLLVVPISFVCEHVETIFEIDRLYKEIAKKNGIKKFVRVPALNTNKYLIQALYNQIIGCLENSQVDIKEYFVFK